MNDRNIDNRAWRRQLIARYLNTETTVEEERLLAEYFRHHAPEEEERDAAILLMAMQQMTEPGDDVDENAEATFDEVVHHHTRSKSKVALRRAIVGIAAVFIVLLVLILGIGHNDKQEAHLDKQATPMDKQEAPIVASQPTEVAQREPCVVTHQGEPQLAKVDKVPDKRRETQRQETSAMSTEEKRQDQLSVDEMVKQIQTITSSDIAEISVRPVGDAAIITATDADGTERSYLTLNSENDTIRYILAFDN